MRASIGLELLPANQFRSVLLTERPIIDVRAPIEFILGALPGSVNFPILNDQEREEIGTLYKTSGSEAAVRRGHELISGAVKESRMEAWTKFIRQQPQTVVTCFRGGMRSQLTQAWLQDVGVCVSRLEGGYKAFRQFLIDEIERLSEQKMLVISGATGSGKTLLIRETSSFWPMVDLEKLAHHRGSAFGGFVQAQPTQIDFENRLAQALVKLENRRHQLAAGDSRPLLIEDESRLVGRCAQPPKFFDHLRQSPILLIEESLASRVDTTFEDYILNSAIGSGLSQKGLQIFDRYQASLRAISKKLGGVRFAEVEKDLKFAQDCYENGQGLEANKVWIEKLLRDYYDPLYFHSLERRQPAIVFRGSRTEVLRWLQNYDDSRKS